LSQNAHEGGGPNRVASAWRLPNHESRPREILASNPPSISISTLNQYPEYVSFREGNGTSTAAVGATTPTSFIPTSDARTPERAD
jgi:hypothetical protein